MHLENQRSADYLSKSAAKAKNKNNPTHFFTNRDRIRPYFSSSAAGTSLSGDPSGSLMRVGSFHRLMGYDTPQMQGSRSHQLSQNTE
jgi:hypothetical protein